jgi:fructose-1,6-bisphosphatase/inositol monophosphatase family enzyme
MSWQTPHARLFCPISAGMIWLRTINLPLDLIPVTEADRAAEKAMRMILADARPKDGILGEEFGEIVGQSGYRWVLDPIDGTRGFISGTPTWGVLIALEQIDHGPVFGMIDQPYIGERFWGGLDFALMSGPSWQRRVAGSWHQIPI